MRYAPSCPAHPFGRHTAHASSVCSFTREVGGGRTVIGRRGVIVAMLALALAGCDGTAVSSAQPNVLESDAEANVGVTASPTPTGHPKPQATAEPTPTPPPVARSEEHTSELQSRQYLVCRLLLEKKKNNENPLTFYTIKIQYKTMS